MDNISLYYLCDINSSSLSHECPPQVLETPLNHEKFHYVFPAEYVELEQSANLEAMEDFSSMFLACDAKTCTQEDVHRHQGDLLCDLYEYENITRSSDSKDHIGLRENLLAIASCHKTLGHNMEIQDERRLCKRNYQGSWERNGKQPKKRLKGENEKWDIAPQVLASRRRREKINEKLNILKTLIPNGNKVDIGTMLERAICYVKFLQLQIKLLSSDDFWMYAPLAYNRMEIGAWPQLDFNAIDHRSL